ncbi:GSCOCG00012543001-RA-CDS, partial [Cotesia congregata]
QSSRRRSSGQSLSGKNRANGSDPTSGDLLITISRKSTDKGQGLQKTIADILKEEAKVICKGPQETIEIRDVDDDTTKEHIQTALKREAGESCEIPLEAIKIRKAFRGTQIATVSLPAAAAQKLLEGNCKIRPGWSNCRIRATKRPIQCFKCWHFGHIGSQCKSEVNRSQHCIRCGKEGHKIADCENPAKCALCVERHGVEKATHHAGSNRCPIFQEALQKITKPRT